MDKTLLQLIIQSPLLLILGTLIIESLLVVFLPKERSDRLVNFLEKMLKLLPITAIISAFKGKEEKKEAEVVKKQIMENTQVA